MSSWYFNKAASYSLNIKRQEIDKLFLTIQKDLTKNLSLIFSFKYF